jgi:hypothetical protein
MGPSLPTASVTPLRILLDVRIDRLALKFHETKDLKVRDEIYRLCREVIKLDEPWKFVVG